MRFALPILVAGLGGLALFQDTFLEFYWPDVRPGVDYLVGQVQPGQRLLINNSWPYTMDLYAKGKLSSSWDVYDTFRVDTAQEANAICQFDWFVDEDGSFPWQNQVKAAIAECGTFRRAFTFARYAIGLGGIDPQFRTITVQTTVWKNSQSRK